MKLFRNPEVRKLLKIVIPLSAIICLVGFIISIECGVFVTAVCVGLNITYLLLTEKRYADIAELSGRIDKILHGEYVFNFGDYSEGELDILKSEIDKMVHRLKEQSEALLNEKIYLMDSIADISHQLRTPLTSINIIVEMLRKRESGTGAADTENSVTVNNKSRLELLKELEHLLKRTDWLIMALLKVSKIDADTVHMKSEPVNVRQLIEKAAEPFLIPMELKEQRLVVEAAENVFFKGDFSWAAEAVGNIIKNCTEHISPGGSIRILCLENPIFTQIAITDDGPGFAPEDLPHLFERFYKGKNSKEQSVGIGLALSKMIVTKQNGTVKAENAEDGGARFVVRFYKGVV